jgi:TolB protein
MKQRYLAALFPFLVATTIAFAEGTVTQLTDGPSGRVNFTAITADGSTVYGASTTNQGGGNPGQSFQIFSFDSATGTLQQLTTLNRGVFVGTANPIQFVDASTRSMDVSSAGGWIAFVSSSDPVGTNADQSDELFVMQGNGTTIAQLTSDTAPNAGSVFDVRISGDGTKVLFTSNQDPFGTNTEGNFELFAINRDGTGLVQLTASPVGDAVVGGVSDDGSRAVFANVDNLTEVSPSGRYQVYAIETDGTNLRRLAGGTDRDSGGATISGDGSKVAFLSASGQIVNPNTGEARLYVLNWDGAGLLELVSTHSDCVPSLSDDGSRVAYCSTQVDGSYNAATLNTELFRIQTDGTGFAAIGADTAGDTSNVRVVMSGDGTKVAFTHFGGVYPASGGSNPDGGSEWVAMDISGTNPVQLTDVARQASSSAEITPSGNDIVFWRSDGLYRMDGDGSNVSRVVDFSTLLPGITGDGNTIVFASYEDPLGTNADNTEEIFAVDADGTNLRQLTDDDFENHEPDVATDGSWVVHEGARFFFGIPLAREIFAIRPDGTGKRQLTNTPDNEQSLAPRVDGSGTWVAFYAQADLGAGGPGLHRVMTDGTGLERIAGWSGGVGTYDIAGNSDIFFTASGDPLGTNPDGSSEIYRFQASSSTVSQVSNIPAGHGLGDPRVSEDGSTVVAMITPALFEQDPDRPRDVIEIDVATGVARRVGSRRPNQTLFMGHAGPTGDGSTVLLDGFGDWTDSNGDGDVEIWRVDRTKTPVLRVEDGTNTRVEWDYEAGSLRYDVIRGNIASLAPGLAGETDLGTVVCIEDESPDATTAGFEDGVVPSLGQAFFYLFRGTQGMNDGPGSYGTSSNGDERVAAADDCPI